MIRPKLGFRKLTNAEKLRFTRLVLERMGENATLFNAPTPTLASIQSQLEAIEARIAARDAHEQQAQMFSIEIRTMFEALENSMGHLVNYVHLIANGDEVKLAASGFQAAGTPGPATEMPKVENLQASQGDEDGEIDLQWNPIRENLRMYNVEMNEAADGQGNWKMVLQQSASRVSVKGLTSGKRYWFRIRAVGAAGAGAPSDPVTRTAP